MVAAVVLAAGASTRFGSPKQRLLLPLVLERVRKASSVGDVVVVLGAHDLETDARVVRCGDWERGPGASLRCGLAALSEDAEAAVVVLADGPDLSPAAVDRVVEAWRRGGGDVLAASYGGVRGHPVLLARAAWGRIPDEGARALEPRLIACDDLGAPGDVDRLSDLSGRGGGEWAAEAVVDEELARRLVTAQFPEIPLRSLRLLGEGWDNTVWLADERWVFRFPRRLIAVPAVERQLAVLPGLAPLLPLPISAPRFAGRPGRRLSVAVPRLPVRRRARGRGGGAGRRRPDTSRRAARTLPASAPRTGQSRARARGGSAADRPGAAAGTCQFRVPRTRERFAELERLGLWRPPAATRWTCSTRPRSSPLRREGRRPRGLPRPPPAGRGRRHADGRHRLGRPLSGRPRDRPHARVELPPAGRASRFLAEYGDVSEATLLRARVLALFLAGTLAVYAHREGRPALERESLAGLRRAAEA